MKKSNLEFSETSDLEILGKLLSYLHFLIPTLDTSFLRDTCSGAKSLIYILYRYFKSKSE